jgi:parallel beta-helix repeat protein
MGAGRSGGRGFFAFVALFVAALSLGFTLVACSQGASSASADAAAQDASGSNAWVDGSVDGAGGDGSSTGDSSGNTADAGNAGDSGQAGDSAAGVDAGVPINPNAYYVATNGDDGNPGTLAKPFATLGKAQKAMQASTTIKTTYVRAGTYKPAMTGGQCVWGNSAGSSIALSSADNRETWSFYPPDGYGSAILDGQSTMGNSGGTGGNGTGCAFGASQADGITIVGLQFQNYLYSAFWGYAVTHLTLEDNVVHDITAASNSGGIFVATSPGVVVQNNYVYDVAYMGIAVIDNSANGDGVSDTLVASNVVLNPCKWPAVSGGGNDQNGGDCGGIYFWSQKTMTSTNLRIANNYVRDVNVSSHGAGDFGSCCAIGIYLDDGTNNVLATGNVITGITSACFHIHGGQNNVLRGNLCDIGASATSAIVTYQNDSLTQMTGNLFEDSVVVAGASGAGAGFRGSNSPPNPMTIQNNAYHNYVGTTVDSNSTSGAGSDSNPTYVDPQVSCWAPTIAPASPVLGAPVSFAGIVSGWGPPGFIIPQTGTAPSWPHGC